MLDPVEAIATALEALAPPTVSVGVRRIDALDEVALFDAERRLIEVAIPTRRREFATGRALLRQLIGFDVPISSRPNRPPDLPTGIVGSLAHDEEFVVAAVGRNEEITALGVDIEPIRRTGHELAEFVLRNDERGMDSLLVFTLKEATYRALSQLGGRLLEHDEVRISIAGSSFNATVETDGAVVAGRFASAGGRWLFLASVWRTR